MNILIIGAGHNGLVAAYYLAKAGLKPLVLERRAIVGGGAVTEEIAPGFHCPTLSHDTATIRRDIVQEMDLEAHGATFLRPGPRTCVPDEEGRSFCLFDDPAPSASSIARVSPRDAEAYAAFAPALSAMASVLASLFASAPPDVQSPDTADLWNLLAASRRFRALGRRDEFRLLRWAAMPVADLVRDWFQTEPLQAALAARGISGTRFGPRSAGSALVLLLSEAHRGEGMQAQLRGGPGALTRAMADAAQAAGADIRRDAPVRQVLVRDGAVAGVLLDSGEEIPAATVVSAVDPVTTFLRLVDPLDLAPDFIARMRNYRSQGTVAKWNLALGGLPRFGPARSGVDDQMLTGRIHVGPTLDYLERACDHVKYGEHSAEPWLDISVPSALDPGLSPTGSHVMSIYVHCAPYQLRHGTWDQEKDSLRRAAMSTLSRYAPGIENLVVADQLLTPADLDARYGFAGGHPFHGELALDQLFVMRPTLGHADYGSPIRQLYLCSAGTHPGGFLSGQSGRLAARRVIRDGGK